MDSLIEFFSKAIVWIGLAIVLIIAWVIIARPKKKLPQSGPGSVKRGGEIPGEGPEGPQGQ
ncbi:MAG: hypothetical protein RL885_12290 [Planctomycetota bacterium]